MATPPPAPQLSRSLEDYLETIYELLRDRREARVRDIAEARGVKAGSVSPALKRLAAMGLVDYAQREHIGLTPLGERVARRVHDRHRLLERLFEDVLRMPADQAQPVACAMEHSLTPAAMDRLAAMIRFIDEDEQGAAFLTALHAWLDGSGSPS